MPAPASPRSRPALHRLAIALVALAAYADSFGASFHLDDQAAILDNPILRDPALFGNPWRLHQLLGTQRFLSYLSRSVGNLSFGLDLAVHGPTPFGFHVVNLAVHVAAALLLRELAILLFRSPFLSRSAIAPWADRVGLAAALLFVAHPIQTQAVTYVVQRYASLSTALGLASLVAWLTWRVDPGPTRARAAGLWAGALAALVAAQLTKESAVTFPLQALLAELLFFDGPVARRVRATVPLLATMAVPLAIVAAAGNVADRIAAGGQQALDAFHLGHGDFLLTELRVVATYLRLLLLPVGQNLFWDYPLSHSLAEPAVIAAGVLHAALLGLAAWLAWSARRADPARRLVAFGVCWFYGALSVESGAVVIVDVIFEHRVYYPSAGFFLAAATAGALAARQLSARWPGAPRAAAALAGTLALVLAGATFARNRVWADDASLWSDVAEKSPGIPTGHQLAGRALLQAGRLAEAEVALRKAIEVSPYYLGSYEDLSRLYALTGRPGRALHALAVARYLTFDLDGALALWDRALALSPGDADAHYGRALALGSKGKLDEARDELRVACGLGSRQACRSMETGARDRPPP